MGRQETNTLQLYKIRLFYKIRGKSSPKEIQLRGKIDNHITIFHKIQQHYSEFSTTLQQHARDIFIGNSQEL